MNILLSGSSGLVGSALLESLFSKGHSITCLKRAKDGQKIWNTSLLEGKKFDAVIHLAGESVSNGRWSSEKKQGIYESRVAGTQELVAFLRNNPPKVFISASAVGYYGDRADELLDEQSSKGAGFLSDVCDAWEKAANPLNELDCRICHLRFGMVVSDKGGGLVKMLPAFRMGVGGKIGSGKQYSSWVSLRDIEEIISFVLDNGNLQGAVNCVSPTQYTNYEFTKILGRVLGKPTIMPLPKLIVSLVFGAEMSREMLFASCRAKPQKLLAAGYKFLDKELEQALRFYLKDII